MIAFLWGVTLLTLGVYKRRQRFLSMREFSPLLVFIAIVNSLILSMSDTLLYYFNTSSGGPGLPSILNNILFLLDFSSRITTIIPFIFR